MVGRDINDLTEMVVRHSPRRSRRTLFGEEEAQQYLLGDGGPLLDENIGMGDLDPAFPDYNVSGLFNAYFRDGDTEDDTLDYWTIVNGTTAVTVEDCAASPGGICLVYAPSGATSVSTQLISAPVPVGPGLDIAVVVAVGNQTSGNISIKASIRWYDEEERLITTTHGSKKLVTKKVLRWLKIDRSKSAQSASFCSLVLEFSATGSGVVRIFGAGLYPLTPSGETGRSAPADRTGETPIDATGAMAMFMYDDFERSTAVLTTSTGTSHTIALPDGLEAGDGLLVFMVWIGTTENLAAGSFHTPDWSENDNGDALSGIEQGYVFGKLLGTEGFSGKDDSFVVAHSVTATSLYALAIRIPDLDYLPTEGFPYGANHTNGTEPGSAPLYNAYNETTGYSEWVTSDPSRRYVMVCGTAAPANNPPTGYTVLAEVNDGSLWFMLAVKDDTASADSDDPTPDPTYANGTYLMLQFGVRVTGTSEYNDGMGSIPDGSLVGAPWAGDTAWQSQSDVTGSADDGQLIIRSGNAHGESPAGTEFLSSWQQGSEWALGIGDGPTVIGQVSGLTVDSYSDPTTTYLLNLPDGCDVPGRHLIAYIAAEPYQDLVTAMVTEAGWTKLLAASGSTWFWKRLGGDDGESATGIVEADATDSIDVDDVGGVTPVIAATVFLVEGLYDVGTDGTPGPTIAEGTAAASADPPNVANPGWTGGSTEMLALTGIQSETAVTRDVDDLYDGDDADEETAPDATLLSLRADSLVAAVAAENPGAYTASSMAGSKDASYTILFRGGGYEDPSVGFVATVERPEGPHNIPHIARIKFKVGGSDNGAYFTYQWYGCVEEGQVRGGGGKIAYIVSGTFINLIGQGQQALSFDLVEDTYYYMLLDFTGDLQRMKVWAVSDPMPAGWDQTFALPGGNDGYAAIELDLEIVAGTTFDIEEIHIGYETEEGTSGRKYLGIADGTTVAYDATMEWGPGGPKIYLDGYLTVLKAFDSSNWSFTFDRAPSYGTKIEIEV